MTTVPPKGFRLSQDPDYNRVGGNLAREESTHSLADSEFAAPREGRPTSAPAVPRSLPMRMFTI